MEEEKNLFFHEAKTNSKRNTKRIYYNINTLFSLEKKYYNTKKENEFYKNSTNFYKSKNNLRISKYNKTDIKFPFIKSNKKNQINYHEINITINNKEIKSEENSCFQRIFKEFKKYDKKYNDITNYFKFFKTSGNDSKIYINGKINNFKHISSVSKPKSRKYCFNVYQRIKSIQ